ncbi:hypothetical protein [Pseudomonas sp. HY2-MNA-CIBAN-0224]|uniref:hypothetical protein n=1 Tax=Pseudomonas sp. HY2-MNA-CIBAN-0224 TaxID=3140471 RepID=UPI0033172F41
MTSLITHLQNKFSDSAMDKLVRDKAISAGTRLLFDFSNSYSNPNPDGTIPFGAKFVNLVDGAPGAVIGGANAAALVNGRSTSGGIRAPASGANGQTIVFGNTYSLHEASPSFIALAWVKCPSNAVASSYQTVFSLIGMNNQNALFAMDTGADGKSPRVNANSHNNVPVFKVVPGFTLDVVHQIGVAWRPGFVDVILDGQVVSTTTNVNTDLLDLSAYNLQALTARQSTTLYRVFFEDLSTAKRSAAAAAAADYSSAKGLYS